MQDEHFSAHSALCPVCPFPPPSQCRVVTSPVTKKCALQRSTSQSVVIYLYECRRPPFSNDTRQHAKLPASLLSFPLILQRPWQNVPAASVFLCTDFQPAPLRFQSSHGAARGVRATDPADTDVLPLPMLCTQCLPVAGNCGCDRGAVCRSFCRCSPES
jgi:hypothetical protein